MCQSLPGLNHIMALLLKDPHRLCVQKSRFNMIPTQGKGMPIKFMLLSNSYKTNEYTQLKILYVTS